MYMTWACARGRKAAETAAKKPRDFAMREAKVSSKAMPRFLFDACTSFCMASIGMTYQRLGGAWAWRLVVSWVLLKAFARVIWSPALRRGHRMGVSRVAMVVVGRWSMHAAQASQLVQLSATALASATLTGWAHSATSAWASTWQTRGTRHLHHVIWHTTR